MGILGRGQSDKHTRQQFERLAKEQQQVIFNAALRLTGNYAEAEDLTQDAFVKAYTAFDQFQLGTNFRAWMFKILTTTHINRYRQSRRTPPTVGWEDITKGGQRDFQWQQSDQPDPESAVVDRYLDEPVGPALQSLPDEFHLAVMLCDMFELSYREIANVLQVPLGTVRSRISRGRQILRERLREYARQHGYI